MIGKVNEEEGTETECKKREGGKRCGIDGQSQKGRGREEEVKERRRVTDA